MPWNFRCRALPLILALLALPAAGQFEVSPDHFDEQASAWSIPASSHSLRDVRHKISAQYRLLRQYREQIELKANQVEKAKEAVRSATSPGDEAAAKTVLQAQQQELEALQRSLAGPIHKAELALKDLKKEQKALLSSAPDRSPAIGHSRRQARALLASSH